MCFLNLYGYVSHKICTQAHTKTNQEDLIMDRKTYDQLAKSKTPPSPALKNGIWAFIVGGLICVIGQVIVNIAKGLGADQRTASTLASCAIVFLGAFFTGLGLYDKLAKYAGAGTVVPISGFANSIVSPAIEFKSEGFVLGVGAKMFTVAGPVIVYGVVASVVYGLIYWIFQMLK
jgi:stage V sporulation protein AC